MCTGIEIALIGATAVSTTGAFVAAGQTAAAAEGEANFRNYQIGEQNKQLEEDRKLVQLQALEQENARRDRSRQIKATNEAFLAGSGVSESLSFEAIDQAANKALSTDIQNIRLSGQVSSARLADQIAVNRVEQQFQKTRASQIATQAYTGAVFQSASSALRNYATADYYRTNPTPRR